MSSNVEDLSPAVRIRLVAIRLFGRQGFANTTVRQIAAEAGISPGLVLHHFGSKDALREACDDWVMEALASEKAVFMVGPVPKIDEYTRDHPEFAGIVDYLVAALREGGPMADRVYDRLTELTQQVLVGAAAQGLVHPTEDADATHAVLAAMSCGLMMLGPQLARRLGGETLTDPGVVARCSRAALELLSSLFTPTYADALRAATSPEGTPA